MLTVSEAINEIRKLATVVAETEDIITSESLDFSVEPRESAFETFQLAPQASESAVRGGRSN